MVDLSCVWNIMLSNWHGFGIDTLDFLKDRSQIQRFVRIDNHKTFQMCYVMLYQYSIGYTIKIQNPKKLFLIHYYLWLLTRFAIHHLCVKTVVIIRILLKHGCSSIRRFICQTSNSPFGTNQPWFMKNTLPKWTYCLQMNS